MELSNAKIRYILMIHSLTQQDPSVRSIEIAIHLGVARSSAHGMLESLVGMGLINKDPRQSVSLTEKGRSLAQDYDSRYRQLNRFFTGTMGLETADAQESAMAMLGNLSPKCLGKLCSRAEAVAAH